MTPIQNLYQELQERLSQLENKQTSKSTDGRIVELQRIIVRVQKLLLNSSDDSNPSVKKNVEFTVSEDEIRDAADSWVFTENAKWSNNDDSAGDNFGSFIAGAKWAINQIKHINTGVQMIAEERQRQINHEGWTEEHDDQHNDGSLAQAAAAYACAELYRRTTSEGYDNTPHMWPFEKKWWKPTPEDRIRELQKSGALIAAEIDRLQRSK